MDILRILFLVSFGKFIDANLKEYQTKDREKVCFDIERILGNKIWLEHIFIKYSNNPFMALWRYI